MKNVVVTVVAYKDRNEFLLLHRLEHSDVQPDTWEFVTGRLSYDTDMHEMCLKQVKKETGLRGIIVNAGKPFVVVDDFGEWRMYPVHVSVNSKEAKIRSKDHSEFAWVTAEELAQYDTRAGVAEVLKQLNLPDNYPPMKK